ncbi:MAG TPA: glycine--tRNA ligase subunit beta [Terriglobales bacterium]|nr:glycine--tRNA ligase subunit beta [Terriglobales bacterium]
MPDFLLEIGCEEIPARMIHDQEIILGARVAKLLRDQCFLAATAIVPTFSTPRRLTVFAKGIAASQPDVEERVTGPSVKIAYKDGNPTPAAEAFAKKVGVDISKLEKISNPKGEYLAATVIRRGREVGEVLSELLPKEISALNWPKNMYWRAGKPERFVRPIRWILALLDSEVIPLEFAGIKAGSESRGHRLFGNGVKIDTAAAYKSALKKAHVIADRNERELQIRKALDATTRTIPGARWREDKDLLDTVVNLTEWPSVILGSFDRQFLSLPEEVLVTVMRDHQKYFAVEDASGKLLPHFLTVLNTEGDPDGLIRHGNERVLRARFNDARFFWDTDQKTPLTDRAEMLKAVTFQKDLGSYHAKADRTEKLAGHLASSLASAGFKIDQDAVRQATILAKTDLTTELVKEFTELQGIIGGLYARAQGLRQAVADSIYDQYKPSSMEDSVPRTVEGAVLSIADKADAIAGMFALGLAPSGSKDPFALRRQANGIIKIIAEHKLLPIKIHALMAEARARYNDSEAERKFTQSLEAYSQSISSFFHERLEFYLREARGFIYDLVNAVLAAGYDDVVDALARAEALAGVRESKDFEAISISFKRVKNILRQARESNFAIGDAPNPALLQDDAERTLLNQALQIASSAEKQRKAGDYRSALAEISKIRPALDSFFDKVMVMVEDEKLRANRLALLQKLLADFSTIADFSEIVSEKKG